MLSSRSYFMAILALGAVVSIADVGFAQRGGGRGFWGGGAGGGGLSTLLRDSKVQEELELVEDQVADLEEIQSEMRQEMMEMFRGGGGFRDLSDDERRERMEELRAKITERTKEMDEEIGQVLLPHQLTRLRELNFQSQIQRSGTDGMADNESIIEALGITDEQKEKMKKAAEEASKKLEEKIQKLRQQAQDEVLAVLTPEQRKKFKELKGESFEFSNNRRGPNRGGLEGRRGGDRGGRGGDQGARRGDRDGTSDF